MINVPGITSEKMDSYDGADGKEWKQAMFKLQKKKRDSLNRSTDDSLKDSNMLG